MTEYEAIIGLETHIQLNTTTKIFCSCKADSWVDPPNSNICPMCTGLAWCAACIKSIVWSKKACYWQQAMQADIQSCIIFRPKKLLLPRSSKGYQISQYDRPLATGGFLDLPMGDYVRRVSIHKLHLEEDAGKTKNEHGRRYIDFNRCGVPLIEMVTGPRSSHRRRSGSISYPAAPTAALAGRIRSGYGKRSSAL
jgi:aspartyl-tRNA(Asn)/glutamyl-tRNA(Gln) amidotransferase subunit B